MAKPQERKFLGFNFTSGKELKRKIAPKAIDRFQERVREITHKGRGRSMEKVMEELAPYLRGWRGYSGFCETPAVLRQLDSWIRRRVRCAFWQQWKTGRQAVCGTDPAGRERRGSGENRWFALRPVAREPEPGSGPGPVECLSRLAWTSVIGRGSIA